MADPTDQRCEPGLSGHLDEQFGTVMRSKLGAVRNIVKFGLGHPLTRKRRLQTLNRIVRWQVGSRILEMPVVVPWVNGTQLLLETGRTGATGNH